MTNANMAAIFIAGLLAITLIDTAGAVASRKLQFKYTYLSIISLSVYASIGYLLSKEYGLKAALLINGILGFYDGTIGLWLSLRLDANIGNPENRSEYQASLITGVTMIILAIVFTFMGYGISYL